MADPQVPTDSSLAEARPAPLSCLELPAFSDACELVSSRYSCLVVEKHRRHLALSPKYLKRNRSGIQEQLNTELLKYSAGLKGVPVAYDNIKLVGELGDIYDDHGHIHINIEADFVIFQPKCGQKLVGVVNKVASSHIGCLVHGCFNASIPKPPKMPVEAWQYLGVKLDDHMEFEVFRLDSDAVGVFCIRGKLDKRLEASALQTSYELDENQNVEDPSDHGVNVPENGSVKAGSETNVVSEKKAMKKSMKRKLHDILTQSELELENVSGDVESCGENSTLEDGNVEISSELKGKTRKKCKKKKHQGDDFQNGIAKDASFPQSSMVEELGEETVAENVYGKTKKKHKDSLVQDPDNIASGIVEVTSDEPVAESLPVFQEVPKLKRHKMKHREHLLQASDSSNSKNIKKAKRKCS
ncbi:DNA-directed RNA polymerase I subunit RPA43 isoform X1 [Ascaphus truei]|uniref:DNA-directed RNA polymerase I subunit RPA43 isoform X1 n=2 Tax=Ascaphus truei TaxID=8439 RepID=UPI003F5AA1AB